MDKRRRDFLVAGMGIGGTAFAAAQAGAALATTPMAPGDVSEGNVSVKSFGARGDGVSDDTAAIETAIQTMKAGSRLYFPGGTYIVSAGLSRLPKHSSVYCCEGAWLKRSPTAGRITFFWVSSYNDLVVNLDGDDLADGKWAGSCGVFSDYNEPAEHVRVHNSRFLNLRTGIRADCAKTWQVHACTFENTENCGILAMALPSKPVQGNVFSGNIFSRMGDYAIAFSHGDGGACEISNNLVTGNVARDTQLRTLGHAFGIERFNVGAAFNNSYIGNIVEQTIDGGYPQGGIVLGDGCRNSVISGNALRGHGGTPAEGINCPSTKSIQITGNHVVGFSGVGIRIDGASRMLVTGNMIENCGGKGGENASILVSWARGAEAVDISGNFIDCAGVAGATTAIKAHGVERRASSNWVIRDNTIIGGGGHGISVAGGGGQLDQIRIANNTLVCERADAFAAISLSHAARSTVSGNAVTNASKGLVIVNCEDIRVDGNSVSDDRPQPMLDAYVEIPGSTGVHIVGNSFRGGVGSPIKPGSLLSQDHGNAAAHNCGLVTEKSGATPPIAPGAAVPHGLAFTPACVFVTPIDGAPTGVCVRNIGEKTFTIDYAGGGMHAFCWRAECS